MGTAEGRPGLGEVDESDVGKTAPASLGWGRAVGGEYRNILEIQLQGWRRSLSKFLEFTLSQWRGNLDPGSWDFVSGGKDEEATFTP